MTRQKQVAIIKNVFSSLWLNFIVQSTVQSQLYTEVCTADILDI